MLHVLLTIFVWLHNFSYTMISSIAVRLNSGEHPKHAILNYHHFFLSNVNSQEAVLDVGCGLGEVASDIAQKARLVVGIDIDAQKIASAKKRHAHPNLTFTVGDATRYPFNQKFDVIMLSNTLEHIKNRVALLQKLKKLAPRLLIRVPLLTRDWLPVYKMKMGFEYRLDKTHFIEFTEEIFQQEIEQAGLRIQNVYTKFGELYAVVVPAIDTHA